MRNHLRPIQSARAINNGIIFYSNQKKDYGVISIVNKAGIIDIYKGNIDELLDTIPNTTSIIFCVKRRIIIVTTLIFLIRALYLVMNALFIPALHLVLGLFASAFAFMLITENMSISCSRFHAAEHMSINAFYDLNRAPTNKEIKKYSRFADACGTNILTTYLIDSSILFGCSFIDNLLFAAFVAIILLTIFYTMSDSRFLNLAQIFTTLKPSDKELKVAIKGLEAWMEYEYELIEASEKSLT